MKITVRISAAALICLTAFPAWSNPIQQVNSREFSQAPPSESGTHRVEIPLNTQCIQQVTSHPIYPELDNQLSPVHQVASNTLDGAIDPSSLVCLGCHDGSIAPETKIKLAGDCQVPFNAGTFYHPLGVDYHMALSRNPRLKPAAFLPSEIILHEGKVGCESCHNLYSTHPNFLVVSNMDSALCLGCHAK